MLDTPGKSSAVGQCAICGREERLTRHHLIPRTRHHNKKNKRDFDRAMVRQVVGICRPCHSQIHEVLTEKQLERDFNTIEKLGQHPEVASSFAGSGTARADFAADMLGPLSSPEVRRVASFRLTN